jgi:hypothetical protein
MSQAADADIKVVSAARLDSTTARFAKFNFEPPCTRPSFPWPDSVTFVYPLLTDEVYTFRLTI